MFNYVKLNIKIKRIKPEFISVDIFDTLLLRAWRSEPLRFYDLSKKMVTEFKKYGFDVKPHFLLRQRITFSEQFRIENQLNSYDHETSYEEIFNQIILDLERRNNSKLSAAKRSALLKAIIGIEIKHEETVLKPNYKLIKILNDQNKKGVKIYFISDMYLKSPQLKSLLLAKKIKFMSGGISSADTLQGKYSGRSFNELNKKYANIKLNKSLHIGDNKFSDHKSPKQIGIQTFLLRMPLHSFKLKVGKLLSKITLIISVRRGLSEDRRFYKNKIKTSKPLGNNILANKIGWLFAPSIIYYLETLGMVTSVKNKDVAFVSSESLIFSDFYKILGFNNFKILPDFNRAKFVRAYCYILMKRGVSDEEIINFIYKVLRTKKLSNASAIMGIKDKTDVSYLFTGSKNGSQKLPFKLDKKLCQKEYEYLLKKFKSTISRSKGLPIISDIGWSGSVQILLEQIMNEGKTKYALEGIYLGRTGTNIFDSRIQAKSVGVIFNTIKSRNTKYLYQPEVWESFLNLDNVNNITREEIISGIKESLKYFKNSNISALDYYNFSKRNLLKVMKRPNREFIEILASLNFDYGTADEPPYPLVNIKKSTLDNWLWLIFNRKRFRSFYFEQGWKWGAATYYHFRIPYRIWRRISKKPSF